MGLVTICFQSPIAVRASKLPKENQMTQDPIEKTIATYDRIAAEYAQRWQDRSMMEQEAAQFAALAGAGGRVLDVGCGAGFDTAVLARHNLRAVGMDLSWGMMQAGRRRGVAVDFVQADMRALPFAAGWDGLWASASLLHVPRLQVTAVLANLAALLKPGGAFYLSVKLGDDEAWTADKFGQRHSRFFTYWQPEALDALLTATGLHIIDGSVRQGSLDTWISRLATKTSQQDPKGLIPK